MRFFRDSLLTLVSVIALLVLFELGLRVTGSKYESSFYESDPVLYMTLRPNAHGWEAKEGENYVRINSVGMRDREHSLNPPSGTARIAVLGDSMIEAEQVPFEKTMAQILERNLNASLFPSRLSAEVLNFGVGGYTLAQEYLMLHNRVWSFHPSVVLLVLSPSSVPSCSRKLYQAAVPYFVVRDGQVVADPSNRPPAEAAPEERRRHAITGDLMNRFRLLQLIRKATQDGIPHEIARLTGAKPIHNSNIMDMWYHPPDGTEEENAWQVAEGLLNQMAEEAHEHGAELWVSAVGNEIEEDPDPAERQQFMKKNGIERFDYSESRLRQVAEDHGIRFISLEPALLQHSEQHQVSLRGFFNTEPNRGHWNEAGNAAAAVVIARELLEGSSKLNRLQSSVTSITKASNSQAGISAAGNKSASIHATVSSESDPDNMRQIGKVVEHPATSVSR